MGAATGHGLGEQNAGYDRTQRHLGAPGPTRKLLSMAQIDAGLSNVFLSQVVPATPKPANRRCRGNHAGLPSSTSRFEPAHHGQTFYTANLPQKGDCQQSEQGPQLVSVKVRSRRTCLVLSLPEGVVSLELTRRQAITKL